VEPKSRGRSNCNKLVLLGRRRKYDQFGFDNLPDDNDTDSMLIATASQLEKRSAAIIESLKKFNVSVAVKWQNYLAVNKYVGISTTL